MTKLDIKVSGNNGSSPKAVADIILKVAMTEEPQWKYLAGADAESLFKTKKATTRSNNLRNLGFMNQPEILNVATSRQLMKPIIVGDDGETFAEGSNSSRRIHDFIASKGSMLISHNS